MVGKKGEKAGKRVNKKSWRLRKEDWIVGATAWQKSNSSNWYEEAALWLFPSFDRKLWQTKVVDRQREGGGVG